ncbi:MAG TPA: aminoglycoside phosphotransferase family protein [Actinomycetales bacterium]|nr:aminoglycoside phosphotransferase family protein [Actinomycetales bacterium]
MPDLRQDLRQLLAHGSWHDDSTASQAPEIELPRGDVTDGVVRVGGTVRRPRQATSAAVAAYLLHLEARGFDEAPRFLGTDDRGRDVLTYVDGDVAGEVPESWARNDALLPPLGALVAALHGASRGFTAPDGVVFMRDLMPDPPDLVRLVDRPTLVSHNDITPQNVVFRNGRPVGLIDFDLAGPTTELRDVANTCMHWAPLTHPADVAPELSHLDPFRRCRLLVDGYGLDVDGRRNMADVLIRGARVGWHRMKANAERLGGGWARMWDEGVGDKIRRREAWLEENRDRLTAALLDGASG